MEDKKEHRQFTVMQTYSERVELEKLGCPKTIPWSLIEEHEAQVKRNHDQTLERLQQRGGLSPMEIAVALKDEKLTRIFRGGITNGEAVAIIQSALDELAKDGSSVYSRTITCWMPGRMFESEKCVRIGGIGERSGDYYVQHVRPRRGGVELVLTKFKPKTVTREVG